MVGHNCGTALTVGIVALPASINNTVVLGSSESRPAITQPAAPAPTTMKSNEFDGLGRVDMRCPSPSCC